MNIINTLAQDYIFTDSEKNVAKYIVDHKENIINMSIQELAKASYTSNPTVLRVCRKCNCTGFKDFKMQLARELEQLTYEISHVDINIPFNKNDSSKQIAKYIQDLFQESIRRTYKLIDEKTIMKAVHYLNKSKLVYLFGYGDCMFPAESFKNKLIKINRHAIIAFNYHQESFHAYNMTNQDCAIMISYRGTRKLLPYVQYLSKKKVPIICITANPKSAIANYANVVIQVAADEKENKKIASFSSVVEIEYIFDVLFSCLFTINYDENYMYKNLDIEELYDFNLL